MPFEILGAHRKTATASTRGGCLRFRTVQRVLAVGVGAGFASGKAAFKIPLTTGAALSDLRGFAGEKKAAIFPYDD